jgi:hypothetical protein
MRSRTNAIRELLIATTVPVHQSHQRQLVDLSDPVYKRLISVEKNLNYPPTAVGAIDIYVSA